VMGFLPMRDIAASSFCKLPAEAGVRLATALQGRALEARLQP